MKTKAILCIFIFCISACNREVNTVDPQVSYSIQDSKINNLFISEYHCTSLSDKDFKITEIWTEDCWKNNITSGNIIKSKTSNIQLILKLDSYSSKYSSDEYFTKWRFEVDEVGVFGRSGNLFTLFMNPEDIKDTINIGIKKFKNDSYISQLTFKIVKLKSN